MDFDAGDIAGDDATAEAPARLVQYDAKRRRPSRTAPASSSGGDGVCVVCMVAGGETPKQWRREVLHKACWNGVRCYLRLQKKKEAKGRELHMFQKKREEWRQLVMPLVVQDGGSRPPSVRATIADTAEANSSPQRYEDRQQISEVRLLDKDGYKAHRKSLDGWASDEASSEFEKEIEKQSDQEIDRHGNPRLRVDGVEVIRTVRGEIRQLGSSRVAPMPPHRPAPSDELASSGSESPRHTEFVAAKRRRPDKSPSKFSCASTSRPSPSEKRNAEASLISLASGSERLAGRSLGVVEFLTEKARLAKECDAPLATAKLKSSISVRLRQALTKVSEAQRSELVGSPDKTLATLDDLISSISRFRAEVTSVIDDTIASSYGKFDKLKAELQQKSTEGEEALAGVKFILDQGSAAVRKNQLSLSYQRRRFEERCTSGKIPSIVATYLSATLQQTAGKQQQQQQQQQQHICMNIAAKEFDFKKFGFWDSASEIGQAVLGKFEEMQSCKDPGVLANTDSLQKTMDNPKNQMCSGAMAKVDSSSMSPAACAMPVCTDRQKMVPSENPCVVCCKAESWRYGPNAWTLPGTGCFIRPLSKGIIIIAFRASDYINKGLFALADLPSFLETASAAPMLNDSVTILDLRRPPGVAWAPYGYLVSPVYVPFEFSEASESQVANEACIATASTADSSLGYIWSYAIHDADMCNTIPEKIWAPIHAMNTSHFERLAGVPLWKERGEQFAELSAARIT